MLGNYLMLVEDLEKKKGDQKFSRVALMMGLDIKGWKGGGFFSLNFYACFSIFPFQDTNSSGPPPPSPPKPLRHANLST